jgi:hypothetical protein
MASASTTVTVEKKQVMSVENVDLGQVKADVLTACSSKGGVPDSSHVLCGSETDEILFCSVPCFVSEAKLEETPRATPINSFCSYHCSGETCESEEFSRDATTAELLKSRVRCSSEPSNKFGLPPGRFIEEGAVCNIQKVTSGVVVSCDGICAR